MTKIKHFEEKAKKKEQAENPPVEFSEVKENEVSPEIIWHKSEEFLKRNQKIITIALLGVLIILGAYFGWRYYIGEQEKSASAKIFPAEQFFRNDSLNKVLKGEGKKYWSAPKVAQEYPLTQSANLAHFYSGVAYLRGGKFKEAIKELEEFSSSDRIIQARAYCLLGDAYMELNQLDNAISYYRKAANYYTNQFYSPMYLSKLALAYELKNDYKNAIAVYEEIIKEHYNSQERPNAQKYKARLEAMQAK
ncbi:tetratricopeptide repeat protein [Raineya orbicola]|uniref:TPR repeat n=1 Tax=Raineya orbicola TaxID=2016530 RepID=A0A2N3I807_9BACT|nr:tetratricopeptide repeat protein [Raineya orbicola]PKQ66451.1 TPR repeat [Raineya orbicola]